MKTVAVTGASGTLGRSICLTMRQAGWRVIGCGRQRPPWIAAPDWIEWDLTDWLQRTTFDVWFQHVDALVHAGAAVPSADRPCGDRELIDANVRSCANLGAWAVDKGVPLVFISGAIVYENPEQTGIKEDMPTGRNSLGGMYGLSKLLGEYTIRHFQDRGLKTAILRPSSIYGTGMNSSKTIVTFLRRALKGKTIELRPPVDDCVDLVNAADVAEAVRLALETGWVGIANVASGTMTSMLELACTCVEAAGNGDVVVGQAQAEGRSPCNRFGLDISRARRELGWEARVPLRAGLRDMIRDIGEREALQMSASGQASAG